MPGPFLAEAMQDRILKAINTAYFPEMHYLALKFLKNEKKHCSGPGFFVDGKPCLFPITKNG
jgi:hypothetical protein